MVVREDNGVSGWTIAFAILHSEFAGRDAFSGMLDARRRNALSVHHASIGAAEDHEPANGYRSNSIAKMFARQACNGRVKKVDSKPPRPRR